MSLISLMIFAIYFEECLLLIVFG